MNRKAKYIQDWIRRYADQHNIKTLVVGVSGGIDSAVVSTLCAHTAVPVVAVSMPILQSAHTHNLSQRHCEWLRERFVNVRTRTIDLTATFEQFRDTIGEFDSELGLANSRARLRMTCLYQIAQSTGGIVVGTGNRVEDFGVGFYTKYGDGGVDISPIGDCLKTEVWAMGRELGIIRDIIDAEPTDGLWSDTRTDQDQLGMTYLELEEAMRLDPLTDDVGLKILDADVAARLQRYRQIRAANLHKMLPIPVCTFGD